ITPPASLNSLKVMLIILFFYFSLMLCFSNYLNNNTLLSILQYLFTILFLFYYKGGSSPPSFRLFFRLIYRLQFVIIYAIAIKFIFSCPAVLYVLATVFIRMIDYPHIESIHRDRLIRLVGGYVNAR